jgi:hypothetical protein
MGTEMNSKLMTGIIRTSAVAFVVAIAVVVSLGATTIDVKAGTKQVSVAQKTENQREACETIGGGKLVVMDTSYGNVTECKGGTGDGDTCFNTPTSVTCTTGDHDPSNANGSGNDVLWQDVRASGPIAPLESVEGGTYGAPSTAETLPLDAASDSTPSIDNSEDSADDPEVADSESTSNPEEVSDATAPGAVVDEPLVADPSAGGAIGDATDHVEQVDGSVDNLYFLDYELE